MTTNSFNINCFFTGKMAPSAWHFTSITWVQTHCHIGKKKHPSYRIICTYIDQLYIISNHMISYITIHKKIIYIEIILYNINTCKWCTENDLFTLFSSSLSFAHAPNAPSSPGRAGDSLTTGVGIGPNTVDCCDNIKYRISINYSKLYQSNIWSTLAKLI